MRRSAICVIKRLRVPIESGVIIRKWYALSDTGVEAALLWAGSVPDLSASPLPRQEVWRRLIDRRSPNGPRSSVRRCRLVLGQEAGFSFH